jgi:hypothetical protein
MRRLNKALSKVILDIKVTKMKTVLLKLISIEWLDSIAEVNAKWQFSLWKMMNRN